MSATLNERQSVRTAVRGSYIVAYDSGTHRIIEDGVLVHDAGTIVHVGKTFDGAVDVELDARGCVVAPGFISTHTHMSGSPFDMSLQDDVRTRFLWGSTLYDVLTPIRDATSEKIASAAARASCLELIRSGVTTAVDLTAWGRVTATAVAEAGLRGYIGQYIRSAIWRSDGRDVSYVPLDATKESEILRDALELIKELQRADAPILGYLAPAQVDTCSVQLLQQVAQLGEELDVPIQIHASQSVVEFREIMRRYGKTPIEFLSDCGLLSRRLIIGHCLFTAGHSWIDEPWADDLSLLAESGATVAHCPTVFARHGQAMESLGRYLRRGVKIALGLDTSPQSMLLEMRQAATLAKVVGRSADAVTAADVFDAATLAPAHALGRDDLGRLSVGSKADFVIYRCNTPSMTPMRDPVRNIVYSALPSDIKSVYVDGRLIMSDEQPTYADAGEILRNLAEAASDIWDGFHNHHPAGSQLDEISPMTYPRWAAE